MVSRCAAISLAAICFTAGCASPTTMRSHSRGATNAASASTVVTADELAAFASQGSLMDALQGLRPSMLVNRGTPPYISVDNSPLAELSLLQTIPASAVREVRLQRSSASSGHSAIGAGGQVIHADVIAVTTWPGGRRQR